MSSNEERGAIVSWLRLVAKARDDRADPEWAMALSGAADFIERGEHLKETAAERARDELAAQAQELNMGYELPVGEASCPMCCGPVDADGMTFATCASLAVDAKKMSIAREDLRFIRSIALANHGAAFDLILAAADRALCDSDGTATAAANGDLPVPQDCQARAGTASPQR